MTLPAAYLKFCGHLLLFIIYSFALPHHLATFFAPFKRMALTSNRPGVHFDQIAEVLSFNLVSIGIGIVARTLVIVTGLLLFSCALITVLISLPLFFCCLPLIALKVLLQKTVAKRQLKRLVLKMASDPDLALKEIFTNTALGRFIVRKLALSSQEVLELIGTTSEFSLRTTPASIEEFLLSLAKDFAPFKQLLAKKQIDYQDFGRITDWHRRLHTAPPSFWDNSEHLMRIRGIGATWSFGYTNGLEKFQISQDFSQFTTLVGREKELTALSQILAKTAHNSAVVAGDPGIGRHAIVDEFCRRLYEGQIDQALSSTRVIYLDLKAALTGGDPTTSRQQVSTLLEEGRQAGNIILVIDDLDKYLETKDERLDLSDIFTQYLTSGQLRVIGITTLDSYHHYLSQNATLQKIFAPVIVEPPDTETVYLEMELSIAPILEKRHRVEISYIAIKKAITNADRFLSATPFPEKAIDLMDETIVFTKSQHPHMKLLWDNDIELYLAEKINIPVGTLSKKDKEKLATLESTLHKRIIGQDEAISALAKALRRSVLEISDPKKPIGTFLFLGPTGSGKTETAKALADLYFGAETKLIRFDMSQYQGEEGLTKLIGSKEQNSPGQLTSALASNPFSVILLDEIEKAPPLILNLFLTLLDEGYLTDAFNHQVTVRQAIIIGTSNAGGLFIKNQVLAGVSGPSLAKKLLEYVQSEKIFSPEFLNRFDGVIVFKPLSFEEIRVVTELLLTNLQKRLAQKQIVFDPSPLLVEKIIKEGYDPAFGARSIKRYIQDTVEDEVSKKVLNSKQYHSG